MLQGRQWVDEELTLFAQRKSKELFQEDRQLAAEIALSGIFHGLRAENAELVNRQVLSFLNILSGHPPEDARSDSVVGALQQSLGDCLQQRKRTPLVSLYLAARGGSTFSELRWYPRVKQRRVAELGFSGQAAGISPNRPLRRLNSDKFSSIRAQIRPCRPPRRSHTQALTHQHPQIEGAHLDQQSLQHILMSVHAAVSSLRSRTDAHRSLQLLPRCRSSPLPSLSPDAPPIRIHRFLPLPVSSPASLPSPRFAH